MADFNYFDQFQDTTVDLTNYLTNMSISGYDYRFGGNQPVLTTLKNLFTHYTIVEDFKKNLDSYISYYIPEDYTVEQVSYKIYETTEYWWIIYVFNNIKNPWIDWPLSQEQLTRLTELMFNEEGKYSYQTYYNFLHESNENKKKIIILRDYSIRDFIWSYRQQILGI